MGGQEVNINNSQGPKHKQYEDFEITQGNVYVVTLMLGGWGGYNYDKKYIFFKTRRKSTECQQ